MKNQFLSYFLGLIFRIYKILKNCSNNNTQPDVSYFLVPNSNIIKAGQNLNLIKSSELDFKYVKDRRIIVFKIDQDPLFSNLLSIFVNPERRVKIFFINKEIGGKYFWSLF